MVLHFLYLRCVYGYVEDGDMGMHMVLHLLYLMGSAMVGHLTKFCSSPLSCTRCAITRAILRSGTPVPH